MEAMVAAKRSSFRCTFCSEPFEDADGVFASFSAESGVALQTFGFLDCLPVAELLDAEQ